MVADQGLHGKGEADTELQMAKKGARVPIRTEPHFCDPPVQMSCPTSVVRITEVGSAVGVRGMRMTF